MHYTKFSFLIKLTFVCLLVHPIFAQEQAVEPNPFDFGRMWTFEEPPTDWFKDAYGIEADQAWFDNVRKSSLKFASWCSASLSRLMV